MFLVPDEFALQGVEETLEYRFTDPSLGSLALHPSRGGFRQLEFLGDAILGVVVYTLAEFSRLPRSVIPLLVSNEWLLKIFKDSFAQHSPGNTGDVVEALIGAVYLDGGFDSAASVITRTVESGFGAFNRDALLSRAPSIDKRSLMVIGAHVARAVASDHVYRNFTRETVHKLSQRRAAIISTRRLAERSKQLGLVTSLSQIPLSYEQNLNDADPFRARVARLRIRRQVGLFSKEWGFAKDVLDEHVGKVFLHNKWESAMPEIMEVLGITNPAD